MTLEEREDLMRHRANAVMSALYGLYHAYPGQTEPRRWVTLPPRALQRGPGNGAVMVEQGGVMTLAHNRLPTTKVAKPTYLPIRVPRLYVDVDDTVVFDIAQHWLALTRSDYDRALATMPYTWLDALRTFQRSDRLASLFGLVINRRRKTATFRVNTSCTDALLCAALFITEACTEDDWLAM